MSSSFHRGLAEITAAATARYDRPMPTEALFANLGGIGGLVTVLVGLIYMLGRGVLISGHSVDRLERRYQTNEAMLRELLDVERKRADRATELLERALRSADLTDRVMVVLGEKAAQQRIERAAGGDGT